MGCMVDGCELLVLVCHCEGIPSEGTQWGCCMRMTPRHELCSWIIIKNVAVLWETTTYFIQV